MKKMYKNKRESSNSFSNLELSSSIDLAWSESDMDDSVTKSNLLRTVHSCYKLCKLMEYDSDEVLSKIRKRIDKEIVPLYKEKRRKKEKKEKQREDRSKDMSGDYCDPNVTKHMEALKRQKKMTIIHGHIKMRLLILNQKTAKQWKWKAVKQVL